MFQNVGKRKAGRKAKRRHSSRPRVRRDEVGTVDGQPMNPDLRAAFQAEGLLPPEPAPNRVMVELDNTIPGGFRMVPCP